jgi:hypothetical protein
MDKLPHEVLHRVLVQLLWEEKKQCRLVCKRWANIMTGREFQCNNRFYIKDLPSLATFFTLLSEKPQLANQVEYLTIDFIGDYFDTRKLVNIFPNLIKVVIYHESTSISRPYDYYDTLDRPALELKTGSISSIEYLHDFYHCELTRFLLSNGLCARLETLVLNIAALEEAPNDLLPSLKNMPVLKNLTIKNCPVAMETCEAIHTNIPSLETFRLMGTILIPGELPQQIQPALLLTRLELWTYDHDFDGKKNWLRYIGKKYTNIKHFDYDIDSISYSREMTDMYTVEFPPLLQRIGPQLESLRLCITLDRGYQAIQTLSTLDCRIKNIVLRLLNDLDGINALAQTSFFKYIENLSLTRVDVDVELGRLREMTSLKTLNIYFDRIDPNDFYDQDETEEIETYTNELTLDMNQLFRHFPTSTESVTIGYLFANFDNNKEGETFDIKELEFDSIIPNGGRLDQFISRHLPNLQSLVLNECLLASENIMLPNHHLSNLEVSGESIHLNVCLVTKDETRFFSSIVKVDYTPFNYKGKLFPLSESDIQNLACLTITCASVNRLVISGYEADLKSDPFQASVE